VASPDGSTIDGKPYWDFSNAVGDQIFSSSEVSSVCTLRFNNPKQLRFTFTTAVIAGTQLATILDPSRSVTATIKPDQGGTVAAAATDGTSYALEIPPGAILGTKDIQITMTPVLNMNGFPPSTVFLAGVQVEPEGLFFYKAAKLTIYLNNYLSRSTLKGFYYREADSNLSPALIYSTEVPDNSPMALNLLVMHFSTIGVVTEQYCSCEAEAAGDSLQALYDCQIDSVLRDYNGDLQNPAARISLENILGEWFNNLIIPLVDNITDFSSLETALDGYLSWAETANQLGLLRGINGSGGGNLDPYAAYAYSKIGEAISKQMLDLDTGCLSLSSVCEKVPMFDQYLILAQIAIKMGYNLPIDIGNFCGGLINSIGSRIEVSPASISLSVCETQQFIATVTDKMGNPYTCCQVKWSSSNPNVAEVNASGLISAKHGGQANISAVCGDSIGVATITVKGFAGVWDTYWGPWPVYGNTWEFPMRITVSGTDATGTYSFDGSWALCVGLVHGRIDGQFSGHGCVLTGTWGDNDGNVCTSDLSWCDCFRGEGGTFEFHLSEDGDSFTGSSKLLYIEGWGPTDVGASWNGVRRPPSP
jgi:hypothetical protein